ncbi:TRAP-type C4-dicarboxylate transport system permease small subunit [Natranaerovirga hydrolytica]|uniref:TRAP-type C4-dicarboxylate transport system permease small subunit n=1 Tax=Natranaerovirga hydrolytica TaxID=680378 RepID=A0A4R1MJT6_9FIRM|nr:TRAP transporter small permease subunit [Natranaerovirga hydrolytica]TCK92715.1 TRAP-type C4-dicarboxylate transport system permease small subunit [Natranaerovirga hydrolytica]
MKKVVHYVQKLQLAVGALFLTVFLITVVYQMFSRYAGISATWTEEVAMYSFIWSVFMGAGAMVFEKKHFAFTSIGDMINNPKFKALLSIVIAIIMLIFSIFMVYYGYKVTKQFWNYNWVTMPQFKRGPVWVCIPIAGLTSAIYLINNIVLDILTIVKGGEE